MAVLEAVEEDPDPVHHPPDEQGQGEDELAGPQQLVELLLDPAEVAGDDTAAEAAGADEEELDDPHDDVDEVADAEVEPVDAEAAEEEGEEEGGQLAAVVVLVASVPLEPVHGPGQAGSSQEEDLEGETGRRQPRVAGTSGDSGDRRGGQSSKSLEEDLDSRPDRRQPRVARTSGDSSDRGGGQSSNSLEEDSDSGQARTQQRVARQQAVAGSRAQGGRVRVRQKTSKQIRQVGQSGSINKKMQLINYVVKTKSKGMKNIVVLCTIPNLATLGKTKDDEKEKPAAIKVYDFSKGGTDISDQRCGSYTCATKTRRWPNKMLGYTLYVTRVNAQSVYFLNTHSVMIQK